MGLESFGNNDNYKPIEKKEVNLEAFFEGLKKSNEQISQIRDLEQKDKKQEEQELNIFELYFNGELSDIDLQARLLTISQKENNETVGKIRETEKTSLELSSEKIKELVEAGKLELQKMGEKNEKINNKIIQLDLILDVSGMYKEYLQSVLSNIKLKLLSNKDERYEKQIETIENKIRDINNLIEYINLIGNTDELLNLNVKNKN